MIQFSVAGVPVPQGSKRHVGNGIMIESAKNLKPWRAEVRAEAIAAMAQFGLTPATGPVRLECEFTFSRPKSHYRTGKRANELREDMPIYKASKPDISKLVRAVEDAMTGVVWVDDSQVVTLVGEKAYVDRGDFLGVCISVTEY